MHLRSIPPGRSPATTPLAVILGVAVGICTPVAAADEESAGRKPSLAELRLEVDELAAAVRDERRQLSADRESYAQEARDLELALLREQARVDALEKEAAALREVSKAAETDQRADRAAVLAVIGRLDGVVAAGLPYRLDDRRGAIAEVRRAVAEGQLAPSRGISRIWRLMREDARLAESHGLAREVIEVDGAPVLADVVRLGLAAMLLRLPGDARACLTPRGKSAPRVLKLTAPEEIAAIDAAFDAVAGGAAPGQLQVPARCFRSDP